MLVHEMMKNFICQGCQIGNPLTKTLINRGILFYVVKYFILSQMRHVSCQTFSKKLFP